MVLLIIKIPIFDMTHMSKDELESDCINNVKSRK